MRAVGREAVSDGERAMIVDAGDDAVREGSSASGPLARRAPEIVLLALCVVLLVGFRLRAGDQLGVHNDSWTTANIAVSARNVALNGAAKYGGVAQHQVDRPPFRSDAFYYYAHYPLGTYRLNWIIDALGGRSLAAWRWPPALCSVLSLVLWYLLLCRVTGRWSALSVTVVMGTAYGFLAYADDVHHGYANVLVVGMMLSYVAGVAAAGRRRFVLLAGSWLCVFVNGFLSWEWLPWSQAFYWGHAIFVGAPFRKRWLLVFALAPVLAFAVQQQQRSAAFGGGSGFVDDFLRRTIRLDEAVDTPPGVTLASYPGHVLERFGEFYGIELSIVWLLAIVWALLAGGVGADLSRAGPAFRWMALLFVCATSWWCVMIQHTAVHHHVMRHALFFYSLVVGSCLATAARVAAGAQYSKWGRAAAAGIGLAVLLPHVDGCYRDFVVHFDRSYQDPRGWSSGWREGDNLSDLAGKLPGDVIVLTNNNRLPLLRYWTNLPVYPATLAAYPYRRGGPVLPGARLRIELTASHLKELYASQLPPLVYVYFFYSASDTHYSSDPILWQLIDGTWAQPQSLAQLDNFRQVLQGSGNTRYPVIARGSNWLVFRVDPLFDSLPANVVGHAPPTLAEYGPPR